ncbi:MAG: ATP-binding cassette domain-containing protein [Salibacteraceae bacterium]
MGASSENTAQKSPLPSKDKSLVEINGLRKSFGSNHVLRGFNLQLGENESIAVLGQSGSGKSILIKCIVGLVKPDNGELKVFGKNINDLNQRELDRMRMEVGFLFQSNALYDSMTVRHNLEFPLRRHHLSKTQLEIDSTVEEALDDVGLLHAIDLMPSELSGGMRKRVSLARTLITRPRVMLYDEPTTGLDPITAREINALMIKVQRKYNTSSIIISHDLASIRMTAQRIIMLIDGINYAEGNYEQLEHHSDPRVSAFFE